MASYNIRTIDEIRAMSRDECEAYVPEVLAQTQRESWLNHLTHDFVGNTHAHHFVSVNLTALNRTQPVVVVL
jgi:hypothetical protein